VSRARSEILLPRLAAGNGPSTLRTVSPRVLVVEDESPIRDLVTDSLEEEGYGLEVAASVEEAELRIAEEPPASSCWI
jgi:PleD family two-component response regulator